MAGSSMIENKTSTKKSNGSSLNLSSNSARIRRYFWDESWQLETVTVGSILRVAQIFPSVLVFLGLMPNYDQGIYRLAHVM